MELTNHQIQLEQEGYPSMEESMDKKDIACFFQNSSISHFDFAELEFSFFWCLVDLISKNDHSFSF